MKVIKNEVKESLVGYLKRALPAYGYRYKRSNDEYSSDGHYIHRKGPFGKEVAWIRNGDAIVLYDNDVLKCLVDTVPAWENLTGETVQITLAKQIVEA